MLEKLIRTTAVGFALSALILGATPAVANDAVAEVENLGEALVFHPLVEFDTLVLTVTGPCNFVYRDVVDSGEPVFKLSPEAIDGVYRFELVANPFIDRSIIEILQEARKKDDNSQVDRLCRAGKLPGAPLTQAAGFRIIRGRITYDPGLPEEGQSGKAITQLPADGLSLAAAPGVDASRTLSTRDFVIIDDLIVDGSACIGFDCVNGESFGFDTIRIKENNLRIKFDDTSTAASFPRNDWQLTANDSANGGASKFSIDDISGNRTPFTVEANARSHSLYVDDGGRIGSRTSTPSVEIHTIDGDTPTLRLQQDGSSGFAPQTWDVAGNETNFFVRDVTNGSTLPLRIRPGAPSSAIFIDVDGSVGIGTSSPDEALHVEKTTAGDRTLLKLENNGRVRVDLVGQGSETWFFQNDTGNLQDRLSISLQGSGGTELQVHERQDGSGLATLVVDGSVEATNVTFSSSRKLKTEVSPVTGEAVLEAVSELPIATWQLKSDETGVRHLGPMAEDFYEAFGLGGRSDRISVTDVNGVALAAIQGLLERIRVLEKERTEYDSQREELERRIRALESASQ